VGQARRKGPESFLPLTACRPRRLGDCFTQRAYTEGTGALALRLVRPRRFFLSVRVLHRWRVSALCGNHAQTDGLLRILWPPASRITCSQSCYGLSYTRRCPTRHIRQGPCRADARADGSRGRDRADHCARCAAGGCNSHTRFEREVNATECRRDALTGRY